MSGAAPPPPSLPDEWIRPPSQSGQGPLGPGAPGPAGSAELPGRPTALISRQRRQAISGRRLAEEVQQDVRPGPRSSDAPPEPSAGGLDRGATTARTGGGRAPDAGGNRISLLDGSCSEDDDEDPTALFARWLSERKRRRTAHSALQPRQPSTASISRAELDQLMASGGALSRARTLSGAVLQPVEEQDLFNVPPDAVGSLFGSSRMGILRVAGTLSDTALKTFRTRTAAFRLARSLGQTVPEDFLGALVVFHFQRTQGRVLRTAPFSQRVAEEWAFGYARWAIPCAADETQAGDFQLIRSAFDSLERDLRQVTELSRITPGIALPQSTRNAADALIARFSEFRCRHVTKAVEAGLANAQLASFHESYRLLQRHYSYEHANLSSFLNSLLVQISLAALTKGEKPQQEAYITQVSIAMYMAFILGLRGGNLPPAPSAIEEAVAAGSLAMSVPPTTLGAPHSTVLALSGAPSSHYTTPWQPTLTTAPPPPIYPAGGVFSLDNRARQVAAGYRDPGRYGGGGNGGATGVDMHPDMRKLLFAHQILSGERVPGDLLRVPPATLPPLPTVPSYYAAPIQYPPTDLSSTTLPSPLPAPSPPIKDSAHRSAAGGGACSGFNRHRSVDDLCIPYSSGMLGSWSPYRNGRLPDSCFECGAAQGHFAHECPKRFVRVRGKAPPGWLQDGSKDPAQWDGTELTAAARADYRRFLSDHPVPPHHVFYISLEDIVGPQPPPPRRAQVAGRR